MADRTQEARERAAESLEWHANYHDGMYDIHNAPTEFYGLLKTDHQAADDVLYLADRVAELEAQQDASCARVAALETALRREWWLNHGHDFARLYGDDGEMQCAGCADFKRDSIDRLRIIVRDARMERVALAAAQEPRLVSQDRGGLGNSAKSSSALPDDPPAQDPPPVTVTPILASCFLHGDHAGDECPECAAKRWSAALEPPAGFTPGITHGKPGGTKEPPPSSYQPYGITATGHCGQVPFVPPRSEEPPAEGGDRSPNDCAVHGTFDSGVCPSCKCPTCGGAEGVIRPAGKVNVVEDCPTCGRYAKLRQSPAEGGDRDA